MSLNDIKRALIVFVIPFVFVWLGSLLAGVMNNKPFEIMLAAIVFFGVFIYWLLPILIIATWDMKLEEVQKKETIKRIVQNNPELNKKYGSMFEDKIKNE